MCGYPIGMWPTEPPILSGAGIVLRAPQDADVAAITKACVDPDIARFTRVPEPYSEADARDYLALTRQQWSDRCGAHFAVCDLTGLLGMCSIFGFDQDREQGELGYWMAPWARGRGAAAQAVRLLSDWGHRELGLERIYALIEEVNTASIRVALAAGFHPQDHIESSELKGTLRQWRRYEHCV